MAIEVVMPQMGQSVAEGTVRRWVKQEGERIEKDEALLTSNTDKIDVEIPSPGAGILSRIRVRAGETVPVGTPLATIEGPEPDQPPAGTTPSALTPQPVRSPPQTARWPSP